MMWKALGEIGFFLKKCDKDKIGAYAAQAAFFIILSIFPCIMLFISLIRYTPVTESMVMRVVTRLLPEYISPLAVSVIDEMYNKGVTAISITALMTLWSAGKGIQHLVWGLDEVFDIKETRNWFYLRFRAIFYTAIGLLTIILTLTLLVFGNSVRGMLEKSFPVFTNIYDVVFQLRSLLMFAVFVFVFDMIYKQLPNRKADLKSQLPGSLLCAVVWTAFSFGLAVYVDDFDGFSMYGSLTAVILLMLWLYFCMYILLLCGEFNSIYGTYWNKKRKKKNQQGIDS